MNISFDPSTTSTAEIKGLIAFLSALLPNSRISVTTEVPAQAQSSHPSANGPVFVPASVDQSAQPTQSDQPSPSPFPSPAEHTRRGRRSKAEIAADETAKAAEASTQTPAVSSAPSPTPTDEAPAQRVTEPSTAPNGAVKPVSADELRSLLNAFIQKHSMEEAIEKLKSFGCNRVTEALGLDPVKLNELAASFNE
jgi:hypothetical protein